MHPALKTSPFLVPSRKLTRPRWRRYSLILVAIAAIIVTWTNLLWPNRYLVPWVFGEGIYKVHTPEKLVALTFDDGPDPRYTAEIAQILTDAGAKGTFFVIGRQAAQYPDLIHTLIQQGHELGNHTWNHPDLRLKPPQAIRAELEPTDQILRQQGYDAPIPFRSPYGHSLFVLPQILKQRHQANVLWTVQLNDWIPETPETMMALLAPKFDKGTIILLHDGDGTWQGGDRRNTVAVVKLILEKYIPQGYQFVTLSELLAHGRPQRYYPF